MTSHPSLSNDIDRPKYLSIISAIETESHFRKDVMALLDSNIKPLCGEHRVVCHCFRVSETVIRDAIDVLGSSSVREVTANTGAGAGCTACHCRIKRMLAGESATCSPFTRCGDCGFYTPLCECEAA